MTRTLTFCLTLTLAIPVLTACGPEDENDDVRSYPPGAAVCPEGPARPEIRVRPRIADPGANPNVIRKIGPRDFAIVESFSNTVSVIDAAGNLEPLADVGNDQNPYDLTVSSDELWVTNYIGQSVSVLDRATGELLDTLTAASLDDPSGIGRLEDTVYVTNVAYSGPTLPYGEGSVTAFDASTKEVLGQLDVAGRNTVFARQIELAGSDKLVVVSSGEIQLTDEGAGVESPGAIEIWNPTDDPLRPDRATFDLPQVENRRIGAPGRPMPTPDGRLYFASATAPVLFVLDPESGWLHDTRSPLTFSEVGSDSLHHADIDSRGILYLTSFNEDALYIWDTSCDRLLAGPIDLGESDFLEGPHGVAVIEEAGQRPTGALFITNALSGSEAVGRIEFVWSD